MIQAVGECSYAKVVCAVLTNSPMTNPNPGQLKFGALPATLVNRTTNKEAGNSEMLSLLSAS
jgi:hypothetical protein